MHSDEQFCDSNCAAEMAAAEREFSAFIRAVTQSFGPEEVKLSAEDWLDELSHWIARLNRQADIGGAVTTAASARLTNRLAVAEHRRSDCRVGQGFVGSSREKFGARLAG